jgi:hypothetical protein|tara:strand:+ start:897 stop:1088 length:192 start_codon:yes stop_codon:yes gene_type:complete
VLDRRLGKVGLDQVMEVGPDVVNPGLLDWMPEVILELRDGVQVDLASVVGILAQKHVDFHLPV